MIESSIPVNLLNPGQVFACLGFLEAADLLLDGARGGFDWNDDAGARFCLSAASSNAFAEVLQFLSTADISRFGPVGYKDPPKIKAKGTTSGQDDVDGEAEEDVGNVELSETFPSANADRMALPIRLEVGNGRIVELGHWADGSTRDDFKLYSGNRSAMGIVVAMIHGTRSKPKKGQNIGEIKTKGIAQLWEEERQLLVERPFDVLTPMGGSFNFDPRGAWTAIDAGYSPNRHDHLVEASPVVEVMAAWGLESARPNVFGIRQVRYSAWGIDLPPILARVALRGGIPSVRSRQFRFQLGVSGKNKVVTFAEQEPAP